MFYEIEIFSSFYKFMHKISRLNATEMHLKGVKILCRYALPLAQCSTHEQTDRERRIKPASMCSLVNLVYAHKYMSDCHDRFNCTA